jgi:hypothetical protein
LHGQVVVVKASSASPPPVKKQRSDDIVPFKTVAHLKTEYADTIRTLFGTHMPDDFYELYALASELRPDNPTGNAHVCACLMRVDAFIDMGVSLVGAFDVLAGRFDTHTMQSRAGVMHYRYAQDMCECQTVVIVHPLHAHIAYWRCVRACVRPTECVQ